MSLRKTFFKGVSWVALLRGTTRGLSILKIAAIARILTPQQVGLYGLSFLVISFLEVFTETGINVFLIQEKKKLEEYVSTAWVVSIARGVFISLLIFLLTPLITTFFDSPELKNLLYLIALVPFLRGFINPSLVKYQKEMDFKSDFFFRFIIFSIDALLAVAITWYTGSPSGLIWGLIIGVIFEIVMSFILIKPRPTLSFNTGKARLIISRGKWVTGTGIFQYLFREGDDIFVGKIMGQASLGIYQYAYKIATLPISEVADVFGRVSLPLFVSIADDKRRLRRIYIQSTIGITLFVLPIASMLFVFAYDVVYVLLGDQWLAAAPVLQALAVYSVIRASMEPAIRVFLALKKQEYASTVSLASLVVLAILIYPFSVSYGLVGVGISTILASLAVLPITIYLVTKALSDG